MDDINFVAGLIAGEGSFTHVVNNGEHVTPCFSMGMSAKDEALVRASRDVFGNIGSVNTSKEITYWKVVSKEDLKTFCILLDTSGSSVWRKSNKYSEYVQWREAAEIYWQGRTGVQEREEIWSILDGLHK